MDLLCGLAVKYTSIVTKKREGKRCSRRAEDWWPSELEEMLTAPGEMTMSG